MPCPEEFQGNRFRIGWRALESWLYYDAPSLPGLLHSPAGHSRHRIALTVFSAAIVGIIFCRWIEFDFAGLLNTEVPIRGSLASMNGERKHPVFLVVDEFQRIVAGNLEYILQLARSMNVGVILANQSMEDLRTRTTDLIPTLEANCRYRQWFAVSSSDDRARVVANSGETLEDFVTRSVSENGESYTYIPKLMPRLSQNDVLLITDHRKQSIVTLTRGKGYAQYGGMAVAVESEFHISLAEYQARRRMPWPDAGYGSFIPRTLRAAISKLITPPTPRGPVVTTEFFGRTPDDDSASGPVILPPRPGNGPKRPTAGKKRKDVE